MQVSFEQSDLRVLVKEVVEAVLERMENDEQLLGNKLAFTEAEAAALLSLKPHQLRDCRLRGELSGSRVGKRILYERRELLEFLRSRRQL